MIANVVFYAADPQRLAAFWAAALDYRVLPYDGEWGDKLRAGGLDDAALANRIFVEAPDGGVTLVFRHTSAPKETRNRLHFDVRTTTDGRVPTPRSSRRRASGSSPSAPPSCACSTRSGARTTSTTTKCRIPRATNSA